MGDELMCTPLFRAVKQANPRCRLTFLSRYPDLFHGNPNLDVVTPFSSDGAQTCLQVVHQHAIPPSRPIPCLLAECAGLLIQDTRLDCTAPPVDPALSEEVDRIPRPFIAVQVCSSGNAPNKEWHVEYWEELIQLLCARFHVVEIGTTSPIPKTYRSPRFHTLVGRTDLGGLVHVIRHASVFVGPVSGGMHIANAFGIPSVIVFGGRESPDGYQYSDSFPLYSPVNCAPCWLETPCPHELKCMAMITPEQVWEAVKKQLSTFGSSRKPGDVAADTE